MAKVKRQDGSHLFLSGMTRSGKSEAAFRSVKASPRVIVWDPQSDWLKRGYVSIATGIRPLAAFLRDDPECAARISYRGRVRDAEEFGIFCRLAFAWAKLKPATIIVEELSWITSPGKAPAGWHELVTGGLKYGLNLVSITQRPQESDKTALSQADIVRCFMLDRLTDQKYMAGELGCSVDQLKALEPLHYLEKNRRARTLAPGRIKF